MTCCWGNLISVIISIIIIIIVIIVIIVICSRASFSTPPQKRAEGRARSGTSGGAHACVSYSDPAYSLSEQQLNY